MQIELPQSEQERLAQHAAAAGYDDVERYAAEHLLALAQEPTPDELPPLGDEELQASLEMIDAGIKEIVAGGGLTVDQARQQSLDQIKRNPL